MAPRRPVPPADPGPRRSDRLSAEWLRLAERCAQAGSWSWDVRTGEVFWSDGMFDLFGLDPVRDAPSFEAWRSRVHVDDREAADRQVREALNARIPLFIRYRIVRPGAAVRWVEAYGDTVVDAQGEPTRMSGFCIDSTARAVLETDKASLQRHLDETRRLEAQLRKSRDSLELALFASGLGLWEFDITANRLTVDERIGAMLGRMPAELDGTRDSWRRLLHPDDEARAVAEASALFGGQTEALQVEFRLRHRSNRWVWVLANGRVIEHDAQRRPLRAVGTVQDVSRLKRISDEWGRLVGRFQALLAQAAAPNANPGHDPSTQERSMLDGLSRRQRQTLELIARGKTSVEIARVLQIATATVIVHRREIMRKLGLHSSAELARFAARTGLIGD